MKVLMITGDKRILVPGTEANTRFELQKTQVEKLKAVYWGRGALLAPFKVRGPFDVITAQDPFWRGLVTLLIAIGMRAKLNIQVHTDMIEQSLVRHVLAQIVLRHANSVRVVSEKIRKQIEGMHIDAPIHVLPVFVDATRFQNIQKTQHPRFAKVILWVGRMEAEKDPARALEVLKKVRDHGTDAGLVFLGSGSLEPLVRMQAASLQEHVEFAGWQDPAAYLGMADVVLSTSHHESWGVSMVEALAAGVPVVAPDVGVAREAGAIVVSPDNLADAVVEAIRLEKHGSLQIELLSAEEWAKRWQETL